MRKVEHFICEICGTEYNSENRAVECEKNHKIPTGFHQQKYRSKGMCSDGYPDTMMVDFDDGSSVRYKRG